MTRPRSIEPVNRTRSPASHVQEFASSLAASFQAGTPIAQEALARDLAEEGSDCDSYDEGETPFDDDASDLDYAYLDEPIMYRRPSGVAYGTTRPAIGPRPLDDAPMLTRDERVQSRNEELSLLRDNHILPPKHGHPAPESETWGRRVYRKLFSTKVPLGPDDDESAPLSRVASETTSLLSRTNGHGQELQVASGELAEQWDAAVSAGQIKTTWQREAKTIAVYSRSLVVTFLLQYSIFSASIFTVGHIGKIELGAISRESTPSLCPPESRLTEATVATMTANITCSAPFQGLATSLDTLCAQACEYPFLPAVEPSFVSFANV